MAAPVRNHKPKDVKYTLVRLGQYLWQFKWHLILILVLTILSNLLALIGPSISGKAVDEISVVLDGKKINFPLIYQYVGIMLVCYFISSLMSFIISRMMISVSRKISFKMRDDVFNKLVDLPVAFFDKTQTGDVISRISYDIDSINTSLSSDLIQICSSIIMVIGSFIMMMTISPLLVLIFVFTIPMSIIITTKMARKTKPLFRKRNRQLGELNAFVEEMFTGHKTIKSYHQEQSTIAEFDEVNETTVGASYEAEYYGSVIGPSVNLINNISLALISMFGAILYFYGLTLGKIQSFVLYSRRFSGPINEFANIISDLQSATAAAERVFRLIDEEPEALDSNDAIVLDDVNGVVSVKDISFGYNPEKTILSNLSLDAPKGSLVAIVGPTGAGKTTLINLLMRFYDVDSGDILVDGHSINNITRKSLRGSYAMVLQDTWLFEGTIAENIAFGSENATIDDIKRVAKIAMIDDYIEALPKGYETILTENGVNISKGQKQLLTIARAMLLNSKMLILDEATSNVDVMTENKINIAMRKLMEDKTCFVIAHRLSTVRNADLILVVNDGEIVEKGTHKELLALEGFYSKIYNAQFV